MNLTELKAFIAQIEQQSEGVNPDEVIVWCSLNGHRWRKFIYLEAVLPEKKITSNPATHG